LINEIGVGMMLNYKPHHVFLAEFFMKRFDPTKLEISDRAKELFRIMNHDGSESNGDAQSDKE
jgi:hypothetical protein